MNERILELAEQADIHGDSYLLYQHRLEKFAKLIVRECASIAGKAEYSDTWSEPVEDKIKQHFGVEE